MSKRGVFWGLGGLLGVVLATTLCILLVTVMGTGAQNSSQSSVEPQVTNLPTGETSDYEIAESPEVEQRAPSYQTPFQPNDGSSVALGPLPSESPPEASFTASSSTVARGADDMITAMITVSGAALDSTKVEGETATVKIELSSPLPTGLTLADDDLKLVATNDKRWPDLSGLDENGSVNLVNLFGDGTTAEVPLFVVDDMILEVKERVRLILEASSNLQPHFNLMDPGKNLIVVGDFDIIDNEDGRITIVALDGSNGAETTIFNEIDAIYPRVKLPPGVVADADIRVAYELRFGNSMDENGNVRTPLSPEEISNGASISSRNLIIEEGKNSSDQATIILLADNNAEETELFQLVLLGAEDRANPTTKATAATVDKTPQHITILDDEPLEYEIKGDAAIDEGAGSYTVQLQRKGRLYERLRVVPDTVTVSYTVNGGDSSPASGADFAGNAFPMGEFTFGSYDASSNEVTFTIEDDMLFEGDETFKISVSSGTTLTSTVVTIIDDDPSGMPPVVPEVEVVTATVSLSATSWYEGDDDALVVTFELADGVTVSNDVTIDYELEFPTIDTDDNRRMAADATDFLGATSGSVLIEAGESSTELVIVSAPPSGGFRYLGFNTRREPFGDVAFRQAVATLIDLELIAGNVLGNVVEPLYSLVPENNGFWHNPDVPRYGAGLDREARINEAVGILDAAGYTWTKNPSWDAVNMRVIDGEELKGPDGQLIEKFEILSPDHSYDPFRANTALLIEQWLNQAGIPAEAILTDFGEIIQAVFTDRDFDMWILGWGLSPYPDYLATFFTTDDQNAGGWVNEEYEALAAEFPADQALAERDLARARELAFQMQAILARELPYIILYPNTPPFLSEGSQYLVLADDGVTEESELVGIRLTGVSQSSTHNLKVDDALTIITILDNEPLEYVIEGDETVAEEDGFYVARLRRRGYTLSDDSVPYTISGGQGNTVVDHNDFMGAAAGETLLSGTVTFIGSSALSTEIRVPLKDDENDEGPEMFQISVARGASTYTATKDVTLWDDDDPTKPVISLDPITDLTEGESMTIIVRLSRATNVEVTLALEVSPTLLLRGHPDSTDYTISPAVVTIPVGKLTARFTFETVDDDLYEGDEFGRLLLKVTSPEIGVGEGNIARTFKLIDNDPAPVISLDPVPPRITEGETLTVVARLSRAVGVDTAVSLAVFGSLDSTDYTLSPTIVTIPAGASLATFTLTTIDDVALERSEWVELHLILITPDTGVNVARGLRTFTLVDNEPLPIIMFDDIAPVTEGGSRVITVRLNSMLGVDINVYLREVIGGGAESRDYDLSAYGATIPAGELTAELMFTALDDDFYEGTETVLLRLFGQVNGFYVEDEIEVTIEDNDPPPVIPTVSLDPVASGIREGESLTAIARLSHTATVDITVSLAVRGIYSADYELSPRVVKIPRGDLTATFIVNAVDDDLDEDSVRGQLILSVISPETGVGIGNARRSFQVLDNDPDQAPPTISLDPIAPQVTEGDNLTITVRLSNSVLGDVQISLDVYGINPEGYTLSPTMTVIPAGELTAEFVFSTVDDNVYERDDSVQLELRVLRAIPVNHRETFRTFTLVDNDPLPIMFDDIAPVREGESRVITVRLNSMQDVDIEVFLGGNIGDSAEYRDYQLPTQNATIPAGELTTGFIFTALDDDIYEGQETVKWTLESRINGFDVRDEIEITILDNDTFPTIPTVSLNPVAERVNEGEALTAIARLSHTATVDITVSLAVRGIYSADYELSPGVVKIPRGELSATFTLNIVDDQIYENPDTGEIYLDVVSPETGVGIGNAIRRFDVFDNDPYQAPPTISLDPIAPQVTEGDNLTVTVRLSHSVPGDVPIFLRVRNLDFEDYMFSPTMTVIPAGELTAEFVFSAVDDNFHEGDEFVELNLSVISAINVNYRDTYRTFTLVDNELAVSIESLAQRITEGEAVPLVARLSHRQDVDVELLVESYLSSAQRPWDFYPGSDQLDYETHPERYYHTRPILRIPAGELTTTFTLNVVDDDFYEGTETASLYFRVSIGDGLTFNTDEFVITLEDNDPIPTTPTVSLDIPTRREIIEGDSLMVTARLSDMVAFGVTVSLEVLGVYPAEYHLSPVKVIPAGELTTTFTLRTVDDEADEFSNYGVLLLSLVNPDTSVDVGNAERGFWVYDNDPPQTPPVVSLDPIESQLMEGEKLTITVRLDRMSRGDVPVSLEFEGIDPADYTLSPTIAVIPAGGLTTEVVFSALENTVYGGTKNIEMVWNVLGVIKIDGGHSGRRVFKLVDNDPRSSISFIATESTIAEDATNLQHDIELQLSGVLEDEIEVTFTVAGSATRSGMNADYILTATTVTIPANTPDAIIQLDVNNDDLYDGRPHETVVLSLVSATGGVTVDATKDDHTVTITDNETAPTVVFNTDSSTSNEGTTANVVVELDGDLHESDVVVNFTVGGTAVAGNDYTSPASSVTIPAGERSAMITFNIDADQHYEGAAETVVLTLTSATGDVTLGATSVHTVTIMDAETAPTLSLSGPSTVSENDASVVFKAMLSGALLEANLEVELVMVGGNAEAKDYTLSPARATIQGGQREVAFTLRTNNNEVLQGNKTVDLQLRRVSGPVVTLGVIELTLTIEEDEQTVIVMPELDVVTVTVSFSATSWYEGDDDILTATIKLANGMVAQSDITIDYELEFPTIDTDGNRRRAADVADFVGATSGSVLIKAGESSVNLTATINPSDGYRYLGFNARGGRGPFVNVAFRQAVATLIDTEQIARDVLQGVVSPVYSVVPEENGFWHNPDLPRFGSGLDREARINEAVRILATGGYTWTVAPSWDAINGRVIAGEGFADSAGQEVRKFKILSVEQSYDPFRFEATSLIAGWLNEAGITAEVTTSSIDTIVSKIRDHDAWVLGWNLPHYPRHLEDTFTTGAFYNLGRWFNAEYDRLAAQFPTDEPTDAMELARVRELAFQLQTFLAHELPHVVLFPNPPATGDLALADDSASEEPELFTIRLTGARAATPLNVRVTEEPAIITILDNDAVEYVIEGAETVAEEDGVYVARLRRRGYTLPDASVEYTVIGLGPNAADHNDFVSGARLPSGAVTFVGHDALSTEIRIPIMDDAVSEGREAFQIVVARGVSILPATRDVTLWDADASRPVISLDPITDITEGENLKITARLSSIAMNNVTLSLTVSSTLLSDAYPDSADDYTLSSPQTIQAGDLTTTFILKTLDDAIYEGTEFGKLVLTIISPSTGVDAGNVERTFRLIDNDPVPVVSLDPVDARITEVET